jgi:hypothetical protein
VAYIILLAFNISVKVIPPGIHETNSVSNCGNTNENNVNINADNGDEIDVKTNQKSKQDKSCNDGASCGTPGSNSIDIGQQEEEEEEAQGQEQLEAQDKEDVKKSKEQKNR